MDVVSSFVSVDAYHLAEILVVHAYAFLWRIGLIHTPKGK